MGSLLYLDSLLSGVGTFLIKIWWFKLLAAGYLLYMVWDYFRNKDENEDGINESLQKGFWATVLSIELMDITFSIDSVTAAFGYLVKCGFYF